jgi:hypothetical protein
MIDRRRIAGRRVRVLLATAVLAIGVAVPAHVAAAPASAATTTCYQATPTKTFSQIVGNRKAWYNLKWCSSGGKITSTSLFWCDGDGSVIYAYTGCSVKTTTGNGSSYYGVSGKWTFRSGAAGAYVYSFITVTAKHNANGTYSGTWCLNC